MQKTYPDICMSGNIWKQTNIADINRKKNNTKPKEVIARDDTGNWSMSASRIWDDDVWISKDNCDL